MISNNKMLKSQKRQRISIADFQRKGLGQKLQKTVESKEEENLIEEKRIEEKLTEPKLKPIDEPSVGFSDEYTKNIYRIKTAHMKMCRDLRIQCRGRSKMFNYLKKNDFYVTSNKKQTQVDVDGKRIHINKEAPKYPMRLTFFNGGKCHFPYAAWRNVFVARAQDIELGNLLYDNDFARSEEGVKLFFELDYRSKDNEPGDETIMKHVLSLQKVVQKFYQNNKDLDSSMWVLLSTAKPKYIATEMHPVISMGCHIIFRNINVNCEQGVQLCHSANLSLESEFGLKNLVDCCYKKEMASLRPIYCRKLEICLLCLNEDDMRLNCEECLCRGKIPSGSIYTVSYLIDSNGAEVYKEPAELSQFVKNNMLQIVSETSIIPNDINDFTPGYKVPIDEPVFIPIGLRSLHKDDKTKDFVFRKDRKMISQRRKDLFKEVVDAEIIRLITGVIRGYNQHYDHDGMILSNVSRNSHTIFVDLRGIGRCFCRIKHPDGHTHLSNRIYFRISKKKKTITQYCYDDDCKLLLTDKSVLKRLTSTISPFVFGKIFVVQEDITNKKSYKTAKRHESMNDFLTSFGS
jgi:hypothetical protein